MVKKNKRQQEDEQPVPLKALRSKTGLTQAKFAVLLGFDPSSISKCERGLTELTFTLKQIKELGRLLEIDSLSEFPDYLGKPPSSSDQN